MLLYHVLACLLSSPISLDNSRILYTLPTLNPQSTIRMKQIVILVLVLALSACNTRAKPEASTQNTMTTGANPPNAGQDTAATEPTPPGENIIKIVSSLPRQGLEKAQTDAIVNAITLRLDESKYQVCNGQFTLQYEDKDDAPTGAGPWDPVAETAIAEAAVADPDVMIYIGPFNSNAAKLSMPILNQANLVMISPANRYNGLTKPGMGEAGEPEKYYPSGKRNYTRVVTTDDIQGGAAAEWAQELGARQVFVLDDQQIYGVSVAKAFEQKATELGLTVLGREGIDGNAPDYRGLAATIKSKRPDLVYFGGTVDNHAGQLLRDLRGGGYQGIFIGPDRIITGSMIESAGTRNAEGMYATQAGTPESKLPAEGKSFLERYQQEFAATPESYAIYGYDAAGAALEALNKVCQKDRAAIRDAVLTTTNFRGALGTWSFDANGDTTLSTIVGYQARDGKWVPIKVFISGAWEELVE